MSEKKEKIKAKGEEENNEVGEKPAGGEKNDDGIATILLKLDLHCEGCAKKVKRSVRHFEGVEGVKVDYSTGKLTVKGNVDPLWLRESVEIKTKKKVSLLSDQHKKAVSVGRGGEKKSDEKVEKRAEEKKAVDEKPKKAQVNTEVAKVRLHCDGSALKVKRFIKELTPYLKDKLNGKLNVPPKKGDGSHGGNNKKEKEVGGKKKDSESTMASKSREQKEQKGAEVMNKKEYYGYNNPSTYYAMPPMYNENYSNQDYGVTMHDHGCGHGHIGYMPPPYLTAPHAIMVMVIVAMCHHQTIMVMVILAMFHHDTIMVMVILATCHHHTIFMVMVILAMCHHHTLLLNFSAMKILMVAPSCDKINHPALFC